jgi:heme/copper-type cytochrome/quinol oxidase subunit 3
VSVTRFTHRRWMFMGFGLAAFLSLAAMNLVWLLGSSLGFGVNEHPYAVFVYALLAAALVVLAISAGTALLAAARSLSGQVSAEQPHLGRAAAWVVHTGTLVWLVVFAVIYLYK